MNAAENNQIIDYLKKHDAIRIGIFGSYSRGEERKDSDVDLLVSFSNTFGLLQLVRIERELSQILGRKVDLVTEQSLKNEKLKKYIHADLKIIFE